jgi:hypothetical protein
MSYEEYNVSRARFLRIINTLGILFEHIRNNMSNQRYSPEFEVEVARQVII